MLNEISKKLTDPFWENYEPVDEQAYGFGYKLLTASLIFEKQNDVKIKLEGEVSFLTQELEIKPIFEIPSYIKEQGQTADANKQTPDVKNVFKVAAFLVPQEFMNTGIAFYDPQLERIPLVVTKTIGKIEVTLNCKFKSIQYPPQKAVDIVLDFNNSKTEIQT
ncbi:MAG: hypothetical protein WAM24_22570, partial [Ignavibacteriaceae bacterium]